MSIEAMKLALAALETCRIRSVSEWSVEDITPKNVTAAIASLRTAIQQAEAQQTVTGEPVAWPLMARVWKRESTQEWVLEIAGTLGDTDMNIRHTQPLSVAYENVPGLPTIYTHPAPTVPAGYVSVPVQVLKDASEALGNFVSDHGWGDADMQAMDNLDAYIARHEANRAAMLAAKDSK